VALPGDELGRAKRKAIDTGELIEKKQLDILLDFGKI
jgi:hypothetical protein